MKRPVHYANADGQYDNNAYQSAYRQQHPDRRALWRLQAALNECLKYPSIEADTRRAVTLYLAKIDGNSKIPWRSFLTGRYNADELAAIAGGPAVHNADGATEGVADVAGETDRLPDQTQY